MIKGEGKQFNQQYVFLLIRIIYRHLVALKIRLEVVIFPLMCMCVCVFVCDVFTASKRRDRSEFVLASNEPSSDHFFSLLFPICSTNFITEYKINNNLRLTYAAILVARSRAPSCSCSLCCGTDSSAFVLTTRVLHKLIEIHFKLDEIDS